MKHALPFVVRLRAHSAGLEGQVERIFAGGRSAEDLLALAHAPLPLLAALLSEMAPAKASIVGILPVHLLSDVSETCGKALAHRASAEAEILEIHVSSPAPMGAIDQACEVIARLRAALPGAVARMDLEGLRTLAEGAGLTLEGAASRLAAAGLEELRCADAQGAPGNLPAQERREAPAVIDEAFVQGLLEGERRSLSLVPTRDATGIQLLRAAALARLAGHHPIAVVGKDELKGPDVSLCFGADRIEAELDPAGSLGSRTRAYGEAAIRGAQLELSPPRRRAVSKKVVAHILDEEVDPALLPGGDAMSLEVVS